MSKEKYNIEIRTDYVMYNTKGIYKGGIVKIPTYIMQDVIDGNKSILIKLNFKNLVHYSSDQLKKNLVTVESRIYEGKFKNENIKYNLAKIKVNL